MSEIEKRERGVSCNALRAVTSSLEEQLGPCVLVLRCYDLIGDRLAEAQKMAEVLVFNELRKLSVVLGRMPGSVAVAEQFLRTIYVLRTAKRSPEAQLTARRFVSAFRVSAANKSLKDGIAFRLGVLPAILDHADTAVLDVLAAETFPWRLAEACTSRNRGRLEDVFAELEDAVLSQENGMLLHPWDDTWHYIVLERIRAQLEKVARGGNE